MSKTEEKLESLLEKYWKLKSYRYKNLNYKNSLPYFDRSRPPASKIIKFNACETLFGCTELPIK